MRRAGTDALRPRTATAAAAPDEAAGDQARILVVDDDERNLLALTEVLQPLAEVVTVSSGRDALRELLVGDFAVILLDVFMPGMDGYETASLIREREQTSRIPIVFLSAVNKETEHLMRGYAMGAVDYVFKPVDPLILRSKAAVFVDLYRLRQQIERSARAEQDLREAKVRADAERLRAERELQQTRLRQAAILEALPLALFEATAENRGRIARRFVGGDIDSLAVEDAAALTSGTLSWEQRIVDEDRIKLDRAYREKGEVRVSQPYRWSRGDGTTLHVLEQAVRIGGDSWVGTVIDLTAQRQLEEQLLQAQKLDALGQLTGGVAHDFNNLLAAMLGGLDLLSRRLELGEREQMIVEQMRGSAQQGVDLVRRLMAFARKQSLTPTAVELHDLRGAVAGIVEHTLSKSIEIDWRIAETSRQLYADRSQLSLALVNLLINARDAMPDGGKVTVSIEESDHDGDGASGPAPYLSVSVADQGVGIPSELIDKVAEPFFTTKPAGEGTGLGLSMVAGFVQQSGGSIRITSEPGEGTTIAMLMPAAPDLPIRDDDEMRSCEDEPTVRSVLLVDDEEAVRSMLSEQLSDFGIEVTQAADGACAIELLREDPSRFDFVLSDLSMPRMNGADLLEAMKAERFDVPFAIMTGNPDTSLLARCDGAAVIPKPLDMAELRRLLTAQAVAH